MSHRTLLRIALLWIGLGSLPALPADWSQWRGPQRTGAAAETLPGSLPGDPAVVWRTRAGEGFASPVVDATRVFLFDNQDGRETLRCLSSTDGSELWRADIDATFRDAQGPPGPRCTPVVDGDRVYAQSCRGELVCLSVSDGSRRWSVNYTRDFGAVFIGEKGNAPGATRHGNNGSPLIEGDRLYASAGSTNGAGVVCLDKRSGAVVWKSGNEVAAYAAPVLTPPGPGRQLVDFMADAALGFDPGTGDILWRHPLKTAFARHVMTPVVFGDPASLIVLGSHQTGLIGLEVRPDRTVRERWVNKEAAPNFSCGFGLGRLYFGLGPDRDLVCVDVDAGQILWKESGWTSSSADRAHAGFVWSGGPDPRALTLLDDGQLVLWEPRKDGYREVSRAQVCGANWCSPAFSRGRLYVRDGIKGTGQLSCIDLTGR